MQTEALKETARAWVGLLGSDTSLGIFMALFLAMFIIKLMFPWEGKKISTEETQIGSLVIPAFSRTLHPREILENLSDSFSCGLTICLAACGYTDGLFSKYILAFIVCAAFAWLTICIRNNAELARRRGKQ